MRSLTLAVVMAFGTSSGGFAQAQSDPDAPVLGATTTWAHPDGTTHYYEYYHHPDARAIYVEARQGNQEVYRSFYTWKEAYDFVVALPLKDGRSPHLATITSAAEQAMIDSLTAEPSISGMGGGVDGPLAAWFGGYRSGDGAAWQWVTSEPWDYENWDPIPMTGAPMTGPNTRTLLNSARTWNGSRYDEPVIGTYPGFIVEYEEGACAGTELVRHEGASDPTTEGWFYWLLVTGVFPYAKDPVVGAEIDGGEAAWSVEDQGGTAAALYRRTLTQAETQEADSRGWRLSFRVRVVQAPQAWVGGTWLGYRNGTTNVHVHLGATADGDPIVDVGRVELTTLDGLGPGFHDYELEYDPVSGLAHLNVDGSRRVSGIAASALSGERYVAWGDGVRDDAQRPSHAHFSFVSLSVLCPNEPPRIAITSPTEGAIVGTETVSVTVTVADDGPTTISSIPPGLAGSLPAGGGTITGEVPVPAEGQNTITVIADDGTHAVGTSVAVIRDTQPPQVAAAPGTPSVVGSPAFDFSVSVGDGTATQVTCGGETVTLGAGGGAAACSANLVEGLNEIEVVVTDAAGNEATITLNVWLDLTAPLVEVTSPTDGTCFGPGEDQIPVVAAVDDTSATTIVSSPSGVSASLPRGGGLAAGVVHLAEGPNTISVTATDEFGRMSQAAVTVRLDTTPPDVAFVTPEPTNPMRGTIEVHVLATDAGCGIDRVELYRDGEPLASFVTVPYEALLDTTVLPDGGHSLRAVGTDAMGNATSVAIEIMVDNTPPTAQILAPVDGALVGGTVPFRVYAQDDGSGVRRVDMTAGGGAPTLDPSRDVDPPAVSLTLEGAEDTTLRPDGTLQFAVSVVDAAGNEQMATATVTTDNTNPGLVCISPANGAIVAGIVRIEASASDEHLAHFEIFVDGRSVACSATSPLAVDFDTKSRFDGAMTIRAVARDAVGNEAACISTVTVDNVTFDLVPAVLNLRTRVSEGPVLAMLSGPNLALFLPTESHEIELRVPGGTPVAAVSGWSGDDHLTGPQGTDLKIRFPRADLVASIQAGLDVGAIQAGANLVPVSLYADGSEIGTTQVRIVGGR